MAKRSGQPTGRVDWNGMDIQNRLRASMRAGSSFKGESTSRLIQNANYTIACGIEVHNWTRFDLTQPCCTVKWGHISSPPVFITPGNKEVMVTHKFGYTMTGSSGIASWMINNNDKRVLVLWSCPYFSTNTLAVGLTEGNQNHNETWYDMILDRMNARGILRYKIRKYNNTCDEIMMEDEDFHVAGSMGTSSKPVIKIIVRPQNMEDLWSRSSS